MSHQIISLSSFGSGVGKNYIANLFVNEGFRHFSWASLLRYEVAKSWFSTSCPEHYLTSAGNIEPDKEWETENYFGDALIQYSKQDNNRQKIFEKNCSLLQGMTKESPVVISDTRFTHEAIFLKDKLNAYMVRVDGNAERGYKEYDLLLTDFEFDKVLDNTAKNDSVLAEVKEIVFWSFMVDWLGNCLS
jgi:hypothetical protein